MASLNSMRFKPLNEEGTRFRVWRVSFFTGTESYMDLEVTEAQLVEFANGGGYLQKLFCNLTPDEREFLKTGATPEDWNNIFGAPNAKPSN